MNLNKKLDISVYTGCIIILLSFAIMTLTGCATWRGMGKDTKNMTNKTANTVSNVFGGGQKKY